MARRAKGCSSGGTALVAVAPSATDTPLVSTMTNAAKAPDASTPIAGLLDANPHPTLAAFVRLLARIAAREAFDAADASSNPSMTSHESVCHERICDDAPFDAAPR